MPIGIFTLPCGRCYETSPEQYVRILTNLQWAPINHSWSNALGTVHGKPTISSAFMDQRSIKYHEIRSLQRHGSVRTKTFLMALLEDAGPAKCLSLLLPRPCLCRCDSSYRFLCIREWNCSRTLFDLPVDHWARVPIHSCNCWVQLSRHRRN